MKPSTKLIINLSTSLGMVSFSSLASAAAVITYGPGATSVPTMGGTMLIALAVLLALVAFRLLKDRPRAGSNMVIVIAAATALATGAGGIKLISEAQALTAPLDMSDSKGGVINVPGPGFWTIINSTDVPQQITNIQYDPGCSDGRLFLEPRVNVLNGAEPVTACAVSTVLAPGETESCELQVFCDEEE